MDDLPFNDTRLKKRIDNYYIIDKNCNIGLERLSAKSRIKFTCEDGEIGSYSYCCRIRSRPLLEIMNSICLIRNFSWNKAGLGYELDDSLDVYDPTFSPRNEHQRRRNELAIPLMDMMDKVDSTELEPIKSDRGIPATLLPPELQKNFRGILDTLNDEYAEKGQERYTIDLSKIQVRMYQQKSPGFKNYHLTMTMPGISSSIGINDYPRWKAELKKKSNNSHYENTDKPLTRDTWKKNLPDFKVSFRGYANPVDIFLELASKNDFPFLCDRRKFWKQPRKVEYTNLSIAELLERIEQDFPETKCEVSRDSIIIVQAPLNPWRIHSSRKEIERRHS